MYKHRPKKIQNKIFIILSRLFTNNNKGYIMEEIKFIVEKDVNGGFFAKAMNYSIFTQGDTIEELKLNIKDSILCHFDDIQMPKKARLSFISEEELALV